MTADLGNLVLTIPTASTIPFRTTAWWVLNYIIFYSLPFDFMRAEPQLNKTSSIQLANIHLTILQAQNNYWMRVEFDLLFSALRFYEIRTTAELDPLKTHHHSHHDLMTSKQLHGDSDAPMF